MIDFYTWSTPNGYKIAIMLEEAGFDYEVKPVDLDNNAQFAADFLVISPNNKIPAIVDHDVDGEPLALFESGAVLTHLADKSGKFLPSSPAARSTVMAWLFWQVGGLGPMLGQFKHFTTGGREADNSYAVDRYAKEGARLLSVLDARLKGRVFVADDYSIADMAIYPWVKLMMPKVSTYNDDKVWENVARWAEEVGARAAIGRAYQILG